MWWFCFLVGASEIEENLRAVAGTYLVGDEANRLETAIRVSVEPWRGQISLIVDRWVRGKLQRLFESSLAGLEDHSASRNVFLINGDRNTIYGSERAPVSLRMRYEPQSQRLNLLMFERGIEIYRPRYPAFAARSDYTRAFDFLSQGLDQIFRPTLLTSFMDGRYRPPACAIQLTRGASPKNPPRE